MFNEGEQAMSGDAELGGEALASTPEGAAYNEALETAEDKEGGEFSGWQKAKEFFKTRGDKFDAFVETRKDQAKKFFKTPGGKVVMWGGIISGGLLAWGLKDVIIGWVFFKKFIEKKGNMTYQDGKDIVDNALASLTGDKKKNG